MITLLIPTMNRSDFLVRLMRYYYDLNFSGVLLIGDSSGPEHAERTQKEIQQLQGRINIHYLSCPGLNQNTTFQKLTAMVGTPYVACLPDDDFIVPSALQRCVEFLETHPSYSSAFGKAIAFSLTTNGAHGELSSIAYYHQRQIGEETAAERLISYLWEYTVVIFSTHRAEVWRKMFINSSQIKDRAFGSELLPCCMAVVLGKVKQLDHLYLARQIVSAERHYSLPDFFDWITGEKWQPSYLLFHEKLAEELILVDGISIDEARAVVKQAFWTYLVRDAASAISSDNGFPQSFKEILRALRGRLVSLKRNWVQRELSRSALLRPGSSYHADFMPIYQSITGKRDIIRLPES